ncbi:hypothetical protein F5Y00DRAFT_271878 [Daldinia vernicosa]|uniref:uncharacterized protein n=1 Tax=Daldinia vernicosa TaxID=114800 RepID=UPI002008E211|nr:uncharacterized protein F5Y00DRAFT_271878 [Daldinia vernicosa]KAI0846574.1 hypothetical protein F5Y00DRAFT_271878 [Daldinia vernicosa]
MEMPRKKKEQAQVADGGNVSEHLNTKERLDLQLDDNIGALPLPFPGDCEAPDSGIDLVFVHGLHGSRLKTWSKDGIFWPRDLLQDDLKNARVITWGYDADIAKAFSYASKESLFGHANTLLADLADLRRDVTRPIVFICHSLGGIVVKEALNVSDIYRSHGRHPNLSEISAKTAGVIFMGTPHRGSDKASYGQIAVRVADLSFRQPNKELLRVLKPNQDTLEKQQDLFVSVSKDMHIVCIREELPTAIGMIVSKDSASYQGQRVISTAIHANHMDMVKFSSRDEGYKRVLSHIKDVRDFGKLRSEQAILEELRFPTINKREDDMEDSYKDTCSWILDGEPEENKTSANPCKFLSWLQNDETFHWISGKAGCGKSTLMKYAYHDKRTKAALQNSQWAKDKNLILMRHFFFELGDADQSSREGMLRTLLYQLLKSRRELIPEVFSHLDLFGPRERPLPGDFLGWNNLRITFISMLNHLQDSRICLFLDGLDEYRMIDRKDDYTEQELDLIYEDNDQDESWGRNKWITNGHKEIAEFIHSLQTIKNVKVCFSSRELNVFEQEFRGFPRIRVHEHTANSISQYCRDFLTNKIPDLPDIPRFAFEITKRARGVFIWVRLVIEILIDRFNDGGYEDELWETVDTLPHGLGGKNGLYMSMMENIKREYLPESKRLFDLVSRWPEILHSGKLDIITLFLAERWHSQGHSRDEFLNKTWEELQPDCVRLQKRLKGRCAGLLEGIADVQFMHQTVKQFLSREYAQDKIFPNSVEYAIPDAVLALMSGLIQRLEHCPEAVFNGRFHPGLRPGLRSSDTDDSHISEITKNLLDSIFECARTQSFKVYSLTDSIRCSYMKLLEDAEDSGSRPINRERGLGYDWTQFLYMTLSPDQFEKIAIMAGSTD